MDNIVGLQVSRILGVSLDSVNEALGIKKINRSKITSITSIDEIFEALGSLQCYDSEEAELFHKQWRVVSLNRARLARNVDEARMVYYEAACEGTEAWFLALAQWERFSMKELRKAKTLEAVIVATRRAPDSGHAQEFGNRKWDRISLKEVRAAKSIKELKRVHRRARQGSSARRTAIRMIANILCKKK